MPHIKSNTQLWVKKGNFIHKVPDIKQLNDWWSRFHCVQFCALCTCLGGTTPTVDNRTYVSTCYLWSVLSIRLNIFVFGASVLTGCSTSLPFALLLMSLVFKELPWNLLYSSSLCLALSDPSKQTEQQWKWTNRNMHTKGPTSKNKSIFKKSEYSDLLSVNGYNSSPSTHLLIFFFFF